MKKSIILWILAGTMLMTACTVGQKPEKRLEETSILLAAAASMKQVYDEKLIPMFEQKHPGITVTATYDSSGKLQTQIQEGLEADLFFSAAVKQMDGLKNGGYMEENSVTELLENKLVLIVPTGKEGPVSGFLNLLQAETIAVGDPNSVPAGQYAKEALEHMGIWEAVEAKATMGTNVTEVLNWVAEGSADAGIVYATDAAGESRVTVAEVVGADALDHPIIYPVGILSNSSHKAEAQMFLDFLKSPEAADVFEAYGFTRRQ